MKYLILTAVTLLIIFYIAAYMSFVGWYMTYTIKKVVLTREMMVIAAGRGHNKNNNLMPMSIPATISLNSAIPIAEESADAKIHAIKDKLLALTADFVSNLHLFVGNLRSAALINSLSVVMIEEINCIIDMIKTGEHEDKLLEKMLLIGEILGSNDKNCIMKKWNITVEQMKAILRGDVALKELDEVIAASSEAADGEIAALVRKAPLGPLVFYLRCKKKNE